MALLTSEACRPLSSLLTVDLSLTGIQSLYRLRRASKAFTNYIVIAPWHIAERSVVLKLYMMPKRPLSWLLAGPKVIGGWGRHS